MTIFQYDKNGTRLNVFFDEKTAEAKTKVPALEIVKHCKRYGKPVNGYYFRDCPTTKFKTAKK